jgi:acetyl-CoA acyltransferase
MKQVQEAYIVAATRSPIGRSHRGYFRNTRPDDLLVKVLQSALAQVPTLDPQSIEDLICGCAMPEGQQGLNIARTAAVLAGLPTSVGGITVNRFCASGLSAIQMAADRIRVGEAEVMIAAGTESMSMVPMSGNAPSMSAAIFDNDENIGMAYGMGLTAEKVANQWKVSREAQDAFACRVAPPCAGRAGCRPLCRRDHARSKWWTAAPTWLRAKWWKSAASSAWTKAPVPIPLWKAWPNCAPCFPHVARSPPATARKPSDGAGALILASEKAVKQYGLKPLAKFVSFASKGVPPHIMGIGPIEAIPAALKNALTQDALDWIELNEAFAAQSLAVMNTFLDGAKVNPLGGAIALGHPLGATGASGPPHWCMAEASAAQIRHGSRH